MIKTLSSNLIIKERFDIKDNRTDEILQSYENEDIDIVFDKCFCDAYVSAVNYVKEHNLEGKVTIYRTVISTQTVEQEVK